MAITASDNSMFHPRWFQFRLRTLFVLVAACAVPCARLAWKINHLHRERAAVAEIERLGGSFAYDWERCIFRYLPGDREGEYSVKHWHPRSGAKPPGPAWLRRLVGDDVFASIVIVCLPPEQNHCREKWKRRHPPRTVVSRRGVTIERWMLCPEGPVIGDEGLQIVAKLSDLEALDLDWTDIGDSGVIHLSSMTKLRFLSLAETNVTDAALIHLRGLTGLRQLYLEGTCVTDAGVGELQRALPNCEITR